MARTRPSVLPTVPGPARTCIGCRARVAKTELLRVIAGTDAADRLVAAADPTGTAPGRGAHLHPDLACFELAVRRRAFGRALRVAAEIDVEPVRAHLAALAH